MSAPSPLDGRRVLDRIEEVLLGGPPLYTREQVADQVGVPLELAQELWRGLGFAHTAPSDVVFTEADVRALREVVGLIEAGVLDADARAALVRTWARVFAGLAECETDLVAGLAGHPDGPEAALEDLTADLIPVVDALQGYAWRRHLLRALSRRLLQPTEAEELQAVAVIEVVGFASRARTLDPAELTAFVDHVEAVSAACVAEHGGRVVTTTGDSLVLVADRACATAAIALQLVERHAEDTAFPELRVGAAYGGVVSRLGEVFGSVVDIATRLAAAARPGRVLVDRGMRDALDGEPFRLRRAGRTTVRGYAHLEPWTLSRASVASPSGLLSEGSAPAIG